MTYVTCEEKALEKATDNKYQIDVRQYLDGVTGGETSGRIECLNWVLDGLNPDEFSRLRVEECSDEHTGQRYGRAKKRTGRCRKIGSGGRNRGQRYAYQVWAVWA